jgi:hypothetical protein
VAWRCSEWRCLTATQLLLVLLVVVVMMRLLVVPTQLQMQQLLQVVAAKLCRCRPSWQRCWTK